MPPAERPIEANLSKVRSRWWGLRAGQEAGRLGGRSPLAARRLPLTRRRAGAPRSPLTSLSSSSHRARTGLFDRLAAQGQRRGARRVGRVARSKYVSCVVFAPVTPALRCAAIAACSSLDAVCATLRRCIAETLLRRVLVLVTRTKALTECVAASRSLLHLADLHATELSDGVRRTSRGPSAASTAPSLKSDPQEEPEEPRPDVATLTVRAAPRKPTVEVPSRMRVA